MSAIFDSYNNIKPNNMHEFCQLDRHDDVVVGGTAVHVFHVNFNLLDLCKELEVVYTKGLSKLFVFSKSLDDSNSSGANALDCPDEYTVFVTLSPEDTRQFDPHLVTFVQAKFVLKDGTVLYGKRNRVNIISTLEHSLADKANTDADAVNAGDSASGSDEIGSHRYSEQSQQKPQRGLNMKTTCLYENEEFGNTVRDILLDKKIQAETTRATEAENRLKESMVTKIQVSTDNVIKLIGLNDKVIAEAPLNIEIPAGLKTISLNGTKLTLAYADDSFKECDLASLLTEVKGDIDRERSRAVSAEADLQTSIDTLSTDVAEQVQGIADRIEVLEQKVANLEKFHLASDN